MTRINSAIHVKCLTDEHLLAEHREIKRLPYCLRKAIVSGSIYKIPVKFTECWHYYGKTISKEEAVGLLK